MRRGGAVFAAFLILAPTASFACSRAPFDDVREALAIEARNYDRELFAKAAFVGVVEAATIEPVTDFYRTRAQADGLSAAPQSQLARELGLDDGEPVRVRFHTVEALKGQLKSFEFYALRVRPGDHLLIAPPPPPGSGAQRQTASETIRVLSARRGDFSDPLALYNGLVVEDLRLVQIASCQAALHMLPGQQRYLAFLDREGFLLPAVGNLERLTGADDPWLARMRRTAARPPAAVSVQDARTISRRASFAAFDNASGRTPTLPSREGGWVKRASALGFGLLAVPLIIAWRRRLARRS